MENFDDILAIALLVIAISAIILGWIRRDKDE